MGAVLFGFIWTTYYTEAPYKIFAEVCLLGLGAYLGKRIAQKANLFGGNNGKENTEDSPDSGDTTDFTLDGGEFKSLYK